MSTSLHIFERVTRDNLHTFNGIESTSKKSSNSLNFNANSFLFSSIQLNSLLLRLSESVTLTANQLPAHAHTTQLLVSNTDANSNTPSVNPNIGKTGTFSGRKFIPAKSYNTAEPDVTLAGGAITSSVGQSEAISLIKPYCAINYIISLFGIYPSEN